MPYPRAAYAQAGPAHRKVGLSRADLHRIKLHFFPWHEVCKQNDYTIIWTAEACRHRWYPCCKSARYPHLPQPQPYVLQPSLESLMLQDNCSKSYRILNFFYFKPQAGNKIGVTGAKSITTALFHTPLVSINLSFNELGPQGMAQIAS